MNKDEIIKIIEQEIKECEAIIAPLAEQKKAIYDSFVAAGYKRTPLWFGDEINESTLYHTQLYLIDLQQTLSQLAIFNLGDKYYYEILNPPSQIEGCIAKFILEQEGQMKVFIQSTDETEENIRSIKIREPYNPTSMMQSQMANNLLEP